jgi:protein disulfide-isomerase A6
MLSPQILAFAFAMAPSLVSAALFPSDTLVKMIDAKGFKKAMKANETSMVAFVAPWCGYCQKMAPEYSKAALGLYPLIPSYAVDCDVEKNKRLCAEQGAQGFPTIKLFPRGKALPPVLYTEEQRTASGFYYFATRGIPNVITRIVYEYDLTPWIEKYQSKPRALLLRKSKKTPMLWSVLANKYHGQVEFGARVDRKGDTSVLLGLEVGEKKVSKVLLFPAGSTNFIVYEGIQKLDSLSKFLDSVLSGTADLSAILEESKAEELVIDDQELEIEQKQEAQKIALMHGGFSSLIDFEEALKDGAGRDFHGSNGYSGIMGGIPEHLKKKPSAAPPASETEKQGGCPHAQKEDSDELEPFIEGKECHGEELKQVVPEVAKDLDSEQSSCTAEHPKDEL